MEGMSEREYSAHSALSRGAINRDSGNMCHIFILSKSDESTVNPDPDLSDGRVKCHLRCRTGNRRVVDHRIGPLVGRRQARTVGQISVKAVV